jgi:uncharacterized protein YdaU (DUF1376 family)
MYPTDFDADTGHLTFAEDGAYNRLLRLSWKCPGAKLPDDMDWIHRRARAVSVEEKALVASVIAEFFTRSGGKIFSPRLAKEWQKSSLAHSKRVSAGSAGGKAKALNAKGNGPSNAKAMLYQPEPEPEPEPDIKREEPTGSLSSDADLSQAFSEYNAAAEKAGWPVAAVFSAKRKSALRMRLSECGGIEGWRAALADTQYGPGGVFEAKSWAELSGDVKAWVRAGLVRKAAGGHAA